MIFLRFIFRILAVFLCVTFRDLEFLWSGQGTSDSPGKLGRTFLVLVFCRRLNVFILLTMAKFCWKGFSFHRSTQQFLNRVQQIQVLLKLLYFWLLQHFSLQFVKVGFFR